MKRRFLLLTPLLALSFLSHAQSASPAIPTEIQFNGHSIRLFQTLNHGFGYDIYYKNALVVHQDVNPYNKSTEGIKNKDDAIKTAKWQVLHLSPADRQQMKKQAIPIEVAQQLNIQTNL
ncbi:MAG: DUF4907 domain-containing protein [Ferruginibacter sp.]